MPSGFGCVDWRLLPWVLALAVADVLGFMIDG